MTAECSGPFDKAGEVPFGLDVLFNAKILGSFLKEGINHLFGLLFLHNSGGWGQILPLSLLTLRHLGWQEERESLSYIL